MAIDGIIDVKPILNRKRINDLIHNGASVSEAHSEFEAAISEILGIPTGLTITNAIFGDSNRGFVAADGSFKMLRFSLPSPANRAGDAVGIEFRDSSRTIRLVQIAGRIQVWYWDKNAKVWRQKIDLEADVDRAITDLEDVAFTSAIYDDEDNEDLCIRLNVYSDDSYSFGLGEDTIVSGAKKWKELTDVDFDNGATTYNPGYSWLSTGSGVKQALLAGDTYIGAAFKLRNQPVTSSILCGDWTRYQYGEDSGYSSITFDDPDEKTAFNLSVGGVYKVTCAWRLVNGPTSVKSTGNVPAFAYMYMYQANKIEKFPIRSVRSEVPWAYSNGAYSLFLADHMAGMTTFFVVSEGGDTATTKIAFFAGLDGGTRSWDLDIAFERIS